MRLLRTESPLKYNSTGPRPDAIYDAGQAPYDLLLFLMNTGEGTEGSQIDSLCSFVGANNLDPEQSWMWTVKAALSGTLTSAGTLLRYTRLRTAFGIQLSMARRLVSRLELVPLGLTTDQPDCLAGAFFDYHPVIQNAVS
jgi:hypothetical protein